MNCLLLVVFNWAYFCTLLKNWQTANLYDIINVKIILVISGGGIMSRSIVKIKLEIIFKAIFGKKENEDLLHSFLSSIPEIPYDSIKRMIVQNSEILPETITVKFSRLDLKLQVDDKLTNVEIAGQE